MLKLQLLSTEMIRLTSIPSVELTNGGQLHSKVANSKLLKFTFKTDQLELKTQSEDSKRLRSLLRDNTVEPYQRAPQKKEVTGIKLHVKDQLLDTISWSEIPKRNAYTSLESELLEKPWIHKEVEESTLSLLIHQTTTFFSLDHMTPLQMIMHLKT